MMHTKKRAQNDMPHYWRYGFLGLPLSLVALSIYVHLPALYAKEYGFPLASLGVLLLLTRLFDMVIDPFLGKMIDRLFASSRQHLGAVFSVAIGVMALSFTGLWFVPNHWPPFAVWTCLTIALLVVYSSYSFLQIVHLSWAGKAALSSADLGRRNASRETCALLGVLLASAAPLLIGVSGMVAMVWAGLTIALYLAYPLLVDSVHERENAQSPQGVNHSNSSQPLMAVFESARFRTLLAVFLLNALASAIPGTLMVFFSQDVLQTPQWTPYFLVAYFACAALSVPVWLRLIAGLGLCRSWLLAIVTSVVLFGLCLLLGAHDQWLFLVIACATGFCLGADLLVPPALLVQVVKSDGLEGASEGSYFAWWTAANKLSLALAAGLTLPLLDAWGYAPGAVNTPSALLGLSMAYALIPCAIKLIAGFVLFRYQSLFKGNAS